MNNTELFAIDFAEDYQDLTKIIYVDGTRTRLMM